MPWLSNAAHSFQIVLGEAKSTADLSWTAWFKDTDAGARTSKPGTPAFGVTNGIAAVQMFTGPASGLTRDLTSFTCFNADDVAHKIQVQVYDGVNTYSIVNEPTLQNVPVGATLCWDELEGWLLFGGAAPTIITASSPLLVTPGLIPNLSLTIGGGTAGAGQYPSNTAAGTLTNKNPLLDPYVGLQQRYYADNY